MVVTRYTVVWYVTVIIDVDLCLGNINTGTVVSYGLLCVVVVAFGKGIRR